VFIFVSVYFVIDSVRKRLVTPSYSRVYYKKEYIFINHLRLQKTFTQLQEHTCKHFSSVCSRI